MDSVVWFAVCASVLGTAGFCSFAIPRIQDWLYKRKLDSDNRMIKEAHELARKEIKKTIESASDDGLADIGNELLRDIRANSKDRKE